MIRKHKRAYAIYAALGAILAAAAYLSGNDFLATLGVVFLTMGTVSFLKIRRRTATPEAAREYEAVQTDERNIYIANKARSLTLTIALLAELVIGLVALLVLHERLLGQVLCWLVSGQSLLYLGLYWFYQKKY